MLVKVVNAKKIDKLKGNIGCNKWWSLQENEVGIEKISTTID